MNADILTTRVADGIAVITMGSATRIYFDAELGDALTEALDRFAGDTNVRVVVVTGGAPGYFIRHFSVAGLSASQNPCALPVASGPRTRPTMGDSSTRPWRYVRACQNR
jgi:enoyl-CoA hydratase/carnithine racemase